MHTEPPQQPAHIIPEPAAARYVGLSRAYLRQARARGRGPSFIRIGRAVRYAVPDLDEWLSAQRVETRDTRGKR